MENCQPAATTESYIRDTKDSLETSLAAEEKYYWVLGYGWDASKLSTRDWYLEPYSAQLVTGGLDTHTILWGHCLGNTRFGKVYHFAVGLLEWVCHMWT